MTRGPVPPPQTAGPIRQDIGALDELSSQAWSPDGRKLVFALTKRSTPRHGPTSSIFVINANGTGIRQLTRHTRDDDPAWSPDGRHIAFARSSSCCDSSIYVMNSDGSHLRRANSGTQGDWNPAPFDFRRRSRR